MAALGPSMPERVDLIALGGDDMAELDDGLPGVASGRSGAATDQKPDRRKRPRLVPLHFLPLPGTHRASPAVAP